MGDGAAKADDFINLVLNLEKVVDSGKLIGEENKRPSLQSTALCVTDSRFFFC
jgi:hypothetical protein